MIFTARDAARGLITSQEPGPADELGNNERTACSRGVALYDPPPSVREKTAHILGLKTGRINVTYYIGFEAGTDVHPQAPEHESNEPASSGAVIAWFYEGDESMTKGYDSRATRDISARMISIKDRQPTNAVIVDGHDSPP